MEGNTTQGDDDLDKKFSIRSELFQKEFGHLKDAQNAFGICFTAIPLEDEACLDNVCIPHYGTISERFKEHRPKIFIKEGDDTRQLTDKGLFSSLRWHRLSSGNARQAPAIGNTKLAVYSYRELHRNGLIEMGFVSDFLREGHLLLSSELPVFIFHHCCGRNAGVCKCAHLG